jgi:hypothetical protein
VAAIRFRDREAVMADLRELPSKRLREVALGWIRRLRREPTLGQPLSRRPGGDLSDCRKLYFDAGDEPWRDRAAGRTPQQADGPRYRIVYRQLTEDRVEIIEVVAVGAKYAPALVYERARRRLDR